jgi:hypothetical protein
VSKFFPSRHADIDPAPRGPHDLPVMASTKNVRELLDAEFGQRISRMMLHTPAPIQRDVMAEMEERFADAFRVTRGNPFRGADDVSPTTTLHQYYAFFTGRAVPARIDYAGAQLSHPHLARRLRRIRRRRPALICLNDAPMRPREAGRRAALIGEALARWYPEPSSFET